VVWALAGHTSAHSIWYAMFGFRIDSVSVLVKHGLETRLSTLESPLIDSGLGLAVILAVIGIVRLRGRPLVGVTALAWMAAPGAERRLRDLLASPERPTWIVRAQGARSFGLDRSGETRRLLRQHYRQVATVCGTKLLLAGGARALPAPRGEGCHGNTSAPA